MATGAVGPAEPQLCQDGLLGVERLHVERKYEDINEKGWKRETYRGRDKEPVMEEVLDGKKGKEEKLELEKKEVESGEARGRKGRRSSSSRYRRRTVKTRKKETKNMKVERITVDIDEWEKDNKEDTGLNISSDNTALGPASCEQLSSKGTTKLWECSKCEAMFRSKVGLDRHMREDHVFLCFVCGEKLSDKKEYEVHTATQHCTQVARCLSCRTNFPSYNEFREHQEHCNGIRIAEDTQIKAEGVHTTPLLQKCIISVDHTSHCHTELEVDNNSFQENEPCKVGNHEQKSKNDTECSDVGTRQCGASQSSGWRIDEQTDGVSQTPHKKSEICPHCGKAFQRRSRLLRHINYHFGNKSFKCVTCGKCFVEKGGLVKHELTHDPLHVPCQECGKVCKTRRTLERHLRTHQNKLYTCQTCNKSYKHEESLRIHKRIHNPHGSGHICVVCEQDCMTAQYLRMHLATRHDGHMLSCHLCTKTFKWKQSLRKHVAMYHSADGGSLECGKCEKPMSSKAALEAHKVAHSEARPFSCTICGKAFKQEQVRDRHTAIVHTDQKQFMCPQCGALFKAKAYLSQHISQVHTTSQPSKCMKCNKSFKTKAILKSHIKIVHTEGKSPKYTCTLCGKSFLSPKDLARHSKIHTGAKDVICKVCGRQFSRKDNMMAHIRVHHNGNKTVNSKEFSSAVKTSTDLTSSSTDSQLLPSFSIVPHSSTSVQGSLLTNEMAASTPVTIHPNTDTEFTNSSTLALDSSITCSSSPDQMINSKELSSASPTIPFSSTVGDTVFSLPNSYVVTSTTTESISSSPIDCVASLSPTCCTTSCVISTSSYPSPVSNTSPSSSNRAVSVSLYQPITMVHNTVNPCGITVSPISASVCCTTAQAASTIGTLTASPVGTPLSAATVGTSLTTAATSSTSSTVAMAGAPLSTSPAVQPEIITVQTGLVHTGFTTVHTNMTPSFTSGANGITSGVIGMSGGVPTGVTSPKACADEDRIYVTTGLVSPTSGGLPSCSSSQQIAQVMTDSVSVGGSSVPLALMLGTASPSLPISTGFTASSPPVENTSCLLETGSILIPHPALLQDASLLVSEKAGVYTVVECGKLSPLETFTLHAAPNSSQASTTLVVQPLPVLSSSSASSTTTTTTTTSIISVPSDATNSIATTESSAQITPTLVLTASVVGSTSSADSGTRTHFSP